MAIYLANHALEARQRAALHDHLVVLDNPLRDIDDPVTDLRQSIDPSNFVHIERNERSVCAEQARERRNLVQRVRNMLDVLGDDEQVAGRQLLFDHAPLALIALFDDIGRIEALLDRGSPTMRSTRCFTWRS